MGDVGHINEGRLTEKAAAWSLLGTIFIAVLGLAAYIPGLGLLGSISPEYIPMAYSTAIFLIFIGVVFLTDTVKTSKARAYGYIVAASIISIFGLVKCLEYFAGASISFEEIVIGGSKRLGWMPLGIMSPSTGAVFFLAGLAAAAYALKNISKSRGMLLGNITGILGCVVLIYGSVFVLGYMHGVPLLYGRGRIIPMALTTSIAFLLLGVGQVVANGKKYFPLTLFSGAGTSARLLRVFIPLLAVSIIFLYMLFHLLPQFFLNPISPLLEAVSLVAFVTITSWLTVRVGGALGKSLDCAEADRKQYEDEIRNMYGKLTDAKVELVQSEKMAALGRFSTGIAHEVKNPLGIILGGTEFLESKLPKGDADAEMVLKKIKEAALRANSILVAILRYARPSSLKIERFMLNDLVVEVSSLFKLHPSLIRIETKIELSKENPCIHGDKNQLQQVMFNMVKNSMEAMPEGGTVTVRVGVDKDLAFIDVIDDGTGMPKEVQEKLFEPFFTTKAGTGTGLGLFVARTIINNHKGSLKIESEPGKGTHVRVILPMAEENRKIGD